MPKRTKKQALRGDLDMHRMAKAIDEIAFYQDLKAKLGPEVWKDIMAGKSADEIFGKWEAHAAGRIVYNALFEPDTQKSTTAAKDILDRKLGKPTEKRTVEHRLGKLPDHELRALVASKMQDVTPPKK